MLIRRSVRKEQGEAWQSSDFPVARWQAKPLQPLEISGGAEFGLWPMEYGTPEQVDAHEEGCDSEGNPP